MIGLLIITHETLGAAYRSLAAHFFPDTDFGHIRILAVGNRDDHAGIIAQAQTMLPELDRGHGVLILADIFGATPCNAAMKLIVPQKSAILTGLNAPMLIRALQRSQTADDLNAFIQAVREAGINGIIALTEPV